MPVDSACEREHLHLVTGGITQLTSEKSYPRLKFYHLLPIKIILRNYHDFYLATTVC